MATEHLSASQVERWARMLRRRGLAEAAIPVLDLLKVWGYVGGQVLWLLAPFLGEKRLAPWAEALEEPDILSQLQRYLIEGEAHV